MAVSCVYTFDRIIYLFHLILKCRGINTYNNVSYPMSNTTLLSLKQ